MCNWDSNKSWDQGSGTMKWKALSAFLETPTEFLIRWDVREEHFDNVNKSIFKFSNKTQVHKQTYIL